MTAFNVILDLSTSSVLVLEIASVYAEDFLSCLASWSLLTLTSTSIALLELGSFCCFALASSKALARFSAAVGNLDAVSYGAEGTYGACGGGVLIVEFFLF